MMHESAETSFQDRTGNGIEPIIHTGGKPYRLDTDAHIGGEQA